MVVDRRQHPLEIVEKRLRAAKIADAARVHRPAAELLRGDRTPLDIGDRVVTLVVRDLRHQRLDGRLRSFERLDEAAAVMEQEPGDAVPAVEARRAGREPRQLGIVERPGGAADIDELVDGISHQCDMDQACEDC